MDKKMEKQKDKILAFMQSKSYIPLKINDLSIVLDLPKNEHNNFISLINKMLEDDIIRKSRRDRLIISPAPDLLKAEIRATGKAFLFAKIDGEDEDVFIAPENINDAYAKDIVLLDILEKTKGASREAKVVKILERGIKRVVGTFEETRSFAHVILDDKKNGSDIYIPKRSFNSAKNGQKVLVEIVSWAKGKKSREGKVVEIIGYKSAPGVDTLSILKDNNIDADFPPSVKKHIDANDYYIKKSDYKNRKDFRNLLTITIDGADSKDLDDAISLEVLDNKNYKLYVHIADVSHYVPENTALDDEALNRATSIYFLNTVIPMIPPILSNGICSLNPKEDRLCLTCVMEINQNADVLSYEIVESVIKSDFRMTYDDVSAIIEDNDKNLIKKYSKIYPLLKTMDELSIILYQKRISEGSIEFDLPESKIIVDEKGHPEAVELVERNRANKIIEEFMLISNKTVAEDFFWKDSSFLFRVHETPEIEKIRELNKFLSAYNLNIKTNKDEVHPKAIQSVLMEIDSSNSKTVINRLVLRTMKQARYDSKNLGHFGLSAKYYCHFTSPIRRYPDLFIHRIIKKYINGKFKNINNRKFHEYTEMVAEESSKKERVAENIEREINKMKAAEFMQDKVGLVFDGMISGLTNWGIYVELDNMIEGMVALSNLKDDYYIFDNTKYIIYGERTKKQFNIGDKVKVKVIRASKEDKIIDFNLI